MKRWLLLILICFSLLSCSKNESTNTKLDAAMEVESNSIATEAESNTDAIVVGKEELTGIEVDKKQLDTNDQIMEAYKEEEKQAVWVFDTLESSNWSVEKPLFIPFMDESKYSSVEYTENRRLNYKYINEEQVLINETVEAATWYLYVDDDVYSDEMYHQFGYDYIRYVESIGAKYLGYYGDTHSFSYEDEDFWWLEIYEKNGSVKITVSMEKRFDINETITIKPEDYLGDEYNFSVMIPDDKYISLITNISDGIATVNVDMDTQYGDYERQTRHDNKFKAEDSNYHAVDNYLYEPGRARYKIKVRSGSTPEELTLLLESKYDVEPIVYGEQLGGILLSSDLVDKVDITTSVVNDHDLKHPDYQAGKTTFDRNEENGFVTYVPAGYYDLNINVNDGIVDEFKTLRVPVHSGKMTEVNVPENITDAFVNKPTFAEDGIAFQNVSEKDGQVTFQFSLLDKTTKSVLPSVENSKIFEGGMPVDIIKIEPIPIPLNVVLLLDSSGSMKGQMQATVDAATLFVESLPDDANITVVDFDSETKILDGNSKQEIMESLKTVKAKGATVLYDSVILGLETLSGEERTALVVFTDGEDANLNDTARGSKATYDKALDAVMKTDVPLFTIGFGEGHDSTTLEAFSKASKGQYYPAENQEALSLVFNAINDSLTNTYQAVYKRPEKSAISDVPVVSIVVDVSGSMSGSRITNVKNICHQFIDELPDETQIMFTTFSSNVSMDQGITTSKLQALNAIGAANSQGGTNIVDSVKYGYLSLSSVPSNKKIMIYVTDAALSKIGSDPAYDKAITSFKDDGIETIWIGMEGGDEKVFKDVSEAAGGDYLITTDPKLWKEAFDKKLKSIQSVALSNDTVISLAIKKRTDEGAFESYSNSFVEELSPIERTGEVIVQDAITYEVTSDIKQYDKTMSQYITGTSISGSETIISKRIPSTISGGNESMSANVEEIVFMSQLHGLKAPRGQRFMGLLMTLENILPEQEVVVYPDGSGHPANWVGSNPKGEIKFSKVPYVIPNYTSHFGMSFNDLGPYPAATATWLTASSLVVPGEYDMTLLPDESRKGMMVFIVPDEPMTQMGIHFFDDNYGDIKLALVGEIPGIDYVAKDNEGTSAKLMDAFDFGLLGYEHQSLGEEHEFSEMRVVDAVFEAEVKANINVSPNKSMYLKFNTQNGDMYVPLSEETANTPLGFYGPTTVMPGARNLVKILFQIPNSFENMKSEIFMDLKDQDFVLPMTEGDKLDAQVVDSLSMDYFDLDINDAKLFDGKYGDFNRTWLIVDVTLHDKKDGYATRGFVNNLVYSFVFAEDNQPSSSPGLGGFSTSQTYGYSDGARIKQRPEGTEGYDSLTSNLLMGLDESAIVYDGTSRRGIVAFSIDNNHGNEPIYLKFEGSELNLLVDQTVDVLPDWMKAIKQKYDIDTHYERDLKAILPEVIAAYKLAHPKVEITTKVDETLYDVVDMPSINSYGHKLLSQINTEDDLLKSIQSLRYLENDTQRDKYIFSSESILTQGFGTAMDMADMASNELSRLGYKVKFRRVEVTEKGEELLGQLAGIEGLRIHTLPAIHYESEKGMRMIVMPFARDINELGGLVYYDGSEVNPYESETENLTVSLDVLPTENGNAAQINKMSGALSGGKQDPSPFTSDFEMFRISLETFSQDAVDIGLSIVGNKVYAVVYTADGPMLSDDYLDLSFYKVTGWSVSIDGETHHVKLEEDMMPNQVLMTLGYNLPELNVEATEYIENLMVLAEGKLPDTLSTMRWMHRKALYSFISAQTQYERRLDEAYGLVTGRIDKPKIIMVQSMIEGGELTTSMDLLRFQNDLWTGEDDLKDSYRLMTGLAASQMEADALPNAIGFEDIWLEMPEEAFLVLFNSRDFDDYKEDMIKAGMTDDMLTYFEDINQMIMIQSMASQMDGKERWAWLEINPKDYSVVSVLDTFEHGSLSSNATLNSVLEKAQYTVGAFKGVETSLWSVGAFSLELTDFKAIIKAAQAFATGISSNFEYSAGPITMSIGKTPALNGFAKEVADGFKKEEEEEGTGFKEGFDDGVKLYFKMVELLN